MSQNQNRGVPNAARTERWIFVMAFAFVPVLVAVIVPQAARIPLLALGGVAFVVGFVLMARESRRSRDSESLRQLVHTGTE